MATKKETAAESVKFPKEMLMKSAIFSHRKDALGVVVQNGEEITIEEAQTRLDDFMNKEEKKGKVN